MQFIEKLTITLDNKNPVEVMDFMKSINAFQKEYRNVCKKEGFNYQDEEVKLYIQVRECCVEWDFVRILKEYPLLTGFAIPTTAYLLRKTVDIIIENVIKKVINGDEIDKNIENSTLVNARDFLSVQKNDSGSNLSLKYNDSSNNSYNFNNCIFHGTSSRGVMDFLEDKIKQSSGQLLNEFKNELMQLTCTSNNQIRGIIETLDKEPKIISFENKDLKNQILINNKENPINKIYLVNGEVKKTEDKIYAYIIKEIVDEIES